ncbi:MAG: hypothetical protein IAE67_02485 [Candidatus Competibacteraceae bacterium]|nr:hypothetical protein [Candidatus Competibacteraceae bacterium]
MLSSRILKRLVFYTLFLCYGFSYAQINVRDSLVAAPLIIPNISIQFPVGQLSDRYGMNFHLGGTILYKHRTNWLWGVSGAFMFGEVVNEPALLSPLIPIFDGEGQLPAIGLGMRGFNIMGQFGKILPIFKKPNRNSGLTLMLGAGYIQHYIYLEARGGLTPQMEGDYLKGYDRMTNGFCASQFIGYTFLGNKKTINFYVGFEIVEGVTQNRRGYNYDTFQYDTDTKLDLMLGVKAGWIFPVYKRTGKAIQNKEKEYYYY